SVAVAGAEQSGDDALEPAAPAHRHRDVLLAVDAVSHRAAVVAAAALELPQLVAGAGVECDELTGRSAGEHQVAGRGDDRGRHRVVVAPSPLLLAVGVERTDGASHVV